MTKKSFEAPFDGILMGKPQTTEIKSVDELLKAAASIPILPKDDPENIALLVCNDGSIYDMTKLPTKLRARGLIAFLSH